MPSLIDRTLILKGPCKVAWNSIVMFSEGDVAVDFITEYFDRETDAFGVLGKVVSARRLEIGFIPKMWDNLSTLYPYATKMPGDPIFGASDLPMVITPRNGAPLTLPNVAMSQLASIFASVKKAMLGPIKFIGLCANSSDPSVAANWFAWGTPASGVVLTGFDLTKVLNAVYTLTHNSVAYRSEDGYKIDFDLGLTPEVVDGDGIINYRVGEIGAALRFTPSGKTEAAYATLLGWSGKGIGAAPLAADAVVAGAATGDPSLTIANCMVNGGGARWGAAINRLGEVEMTSVRTISSNVLSALWTFGTV